MRSYPFPLGIVATLLVAAPFLSAQTLALVEHPIPKGASEPGGITLGPDGNMWMTEGYRGYIAKITPAGMFTEYSLPSASPEGIVSGPDGALWFGETGAIGRITTGGVIRDFLISSSAQALGITLGPDGALWFTENNGRIGRMTTQGMLIEYPLPDRRPPGPNSIVVGPDGALGLLFRAPAALAASPPPGKSPNI